jgi:hypothetical protein
MKRFLSLLKYVLDFHYNCVLFTQTVGFCSCINCNSFISTQQVTWWFMHPFLLRRVIAGLK